MGSGARPKKPDGRAVGPERFEVFEWTGTSHLTAEQKAWPVVRLTRDGRYERVVTMLVLSVDVAGAVGEDPVRIDQGLRALIEAMSRRDVELGGRGLEPVAREAADGVVTVTLAAVSLDGAADRIWQLSDEVNRAANGTPPEFARVVARVA